MKIIDAKGLVCPQPLILTKKALKKVEVNEQFIILLDNETSVQNINRFLKENNAQSEIDKEDEIYKIIVTKLPENIPEPASDNLKIINGIKVGTHVYVFKKVRVAEDELGEMLTFGFLDTIKEVEPLPDKMIFYHEGVKMVLEDSPVLEKLKDMERMGVEILICGDCVNFYKVKGKVRVGTISNAYDILKAFTDAGHLIYP